MGEASGSQFCWKKKSNGYWRHWKTFIGGREGNSGGRTRSVGVTSYVLLWVGTEAKGNWFCPRSKEECETYFHPRWTGGKRVVANHAIGL